MLAVRRFLAAFGIVVLVSLKSSAMVMAQGHQFRDEPVPERSKDTHAINLVPIFDTARKSSTRLAQNIAQQETENSVQRADSSRDPSGAQVRCPTVAVALGGGGIRGAAHIGVLRVLEREGIPIDYIVGTSMGSVVGGLYAAGVSLDDIEKIIINGSLQKAYMPGSVLSKLLSSPIEKIMHPFKKHYAGLWTGKKFGDRLVKQLPGNVVNVEDTPIPFSAVATNLIDGKVYRISNGNLSTAIRASSTIPALLQPVVIGDKLFIDGGLQANLPASAARETGADIVIAILVDAPLRCLPDKQFRHLKGIGARLTDVALAEADARQSMYADIMINPDVSGIPLISGHADDPQKAIMAGETAARNALPEIRKRLAGSVRQAAMSAKKVEHTN